MGRRRRQRESRWTRRRTAGVQDDASSRAEAAQPPRGRRLWLVGGLLAAAVLVGAGALSALLLLAGDGGSSPQGGPRAVIVDQLSLTNPNQTFVDDATALLEGAGYAVDYVPGEQVTVDYFRTFAERDYDYVVMRVHMAQFTGEWREREYDEPVLFTADAYSAEEHLDEQWELQLNPVYAYEGAPRFFGIAPNFIESAMSGDLEGATVVLMGCGGLTTDRLAEAFTNRGAKHVVGWNDLVSAPHTDEATTALLGHILQDDQPVQEALAKTMTEVGRDPAYNSHLLAYAP